MEYLKMSNIMKYVDSSELPDVYCKIFGDMNTSVKFLIIFIDHKSYFLELPKLK